MDRARGRLAVISGHLVAADVVHISDLLEASPVFSDAMALQVLKLGGTLRVIDERNGKEYKVVVRDDATVMASDFKQIRYGNSKSLKLYDPGYINTASARSAICYIDGEKSILRYRGYPIQDLANGRSSFTEVAFLLIYGRLPSSDELEVWRSSISQNSDIPKGVLNIIEGAPKTAHPMSVLISAISELSVLFPDANPTIKGEGLYKSKEVRHKQIVRILGMVPTIVATICLVMKGKRYVPPWENFSYTENFLYMLDSNGDTSHKPYAKFVKKMDILFILHAEHEMNCSTAAARHLASSGVNVYNVLAGALGALYGPLDGGANEAVYKMLRKIGNVQNIPQFIEDVKKGNCKLSGFGHRVYKSKDPRVEIVQQLIKDISADTYSDPIPELAIEVEKAALADEYFTKRNLYPNVHFYSAILYRAMGIEESFFTMVFAIPRMAGFLAHWLESLDDPHTKIIRPQQVYSGVLLQQYVPIIERKKRTKTVKL